jgi:hypothetical protein
MRDGLKLMLTPARGNCSRRALSGYAPVRLGLSDVLQQSSSFNLSVATANLFFQTRTADIDLRSSRWSPHGIVGPSFLAVQR